MKKLGHLFVFGALISMLTSCEVIGGIFKAGVWSGILLVVVVIALIVWIVAKVAGGGKR
ncbi:hypothetical protein [Sphingobacterium sp. LRF_L2]|uniref:hypothetical protein n=1 Tax=Sphingobacterium sp. LRF_L2 TaxID=3369421 RepID=UPI003F5F998E